MVERKAISVLLPLAQERLLNDLKNTSFSIGSDASNKGNKKLFPLVVTHFSAKTGKRSDILDFYEDNNESAESISNKIKSIVVENGLSLNTLSLFGRQCIC